MRGIWPLKGYLTNTFDKYLVLSFISETRILGMEENELGEVEISGFRSDQQTVYTADTECGIVQVTQDSIRLVDSGTFQLLSSFDCPEEMSIVTADSSSNQIVIALSGGTVIKIDVDVVNRKLVKSANIRLDKDVACIRIKPPSITQSNTSGDLMDIDGPESKVIASNLVAFGMWTDNSVRLHHLSSLIECARIHLGTEAQTRAVLLIDLDGITYLFVGLGDGTLLYYQLEWSQNAGIFALENRKKVILGTRPISLTPFTNASNGNLCIFSSGDRPTIIYTHRGRILFSSMNASDVNYMAPFNSTFLPQSLALISENGLLIGTVDDIKKVHVQTFPLGQSPSRIAYHPSTGSFAG